MELTRQPQRITLRKLSDRNPSPPLISRLRVRPIFRDGKHFEFRPAAFINLLHNHEKCYAHRQSYLVSRPRVNSTYTSGLQLHPDAMPDFCFMKSPHALCEHILNVPQNPIGPMATKDVGPIHQCGDAVLLIHGLLSNHALRIRWVMNPPKVLDDEAVSRELKVRIPDAGPPPVDDRQRMLMEIADPMAIQHPTDLRLAPTTESCLMRGRRGVGLRCHPRTRRLSYK